MKNKGFTLVEVLGILVVLVAIFLIAVPNINKWLKSRTEELYKTQINNIILAAKNWASDNVFSLSQNEGESITITLGQLKMNGNLESDFKNPKTKSQFPNDLEIVITKRGNQFEYTVLESELPES